MKHLIDFKKEDGSFDSDTYWEYQKKLHMEVISGMKKHMPEMEALREKINRWDEEDLIYRFYHRSFKTYYLQNYTIAIFDLIKRIKPEECEIDPYFLQIIEEGTAHKFERVHNENWLKWTRPILEAYFHARYFLDMTIRYGKELEGDVDCLPSGWAAILCLYSLR